ncbi:hypothetical protein [Aeoliella mucimassa]|uniref:Uncharacterized protein n=1 Tax=Aeoliella mucimassa TaxID=2527972 RepID=A0A518AHC1_9BACT|nr:hypothetical protein [Aeoliella mucimassa]QDU54130.1 hypothetical protein Pan181_03100 [Aeoliella mucimassa]
MALFVHLAPENQSAAILRDGIKPHRRFRPLAEGYERVVFAMPVTPDFYVSHQWLRELKRRGQRTIVGVYFRIPDDQQVMVGHYNESHTEMSASEAVGTILHADQPEGFEVVIPRKVEASEIHKIRPLPQVVGWRYYPGAKGRQPCGCPFCTKGDIKSKRIRDAYEQSFGE